MMDLALPYFVTNKDWYEKNPDKSNGAIPWIIKPDAPKKAQESYSEFVKVWNEDYELDNPFEGIHA